MGTRDKRSSLVEPSFVGREQDLHWLEENVATAQRPILIEAPSGQGKSAFVEAFLDKLDPETRVIYARARAPMEGTSTFLWDEPAARLEALFEDEPELKKRLRTELPESSRQALQSFLPRWTFLEVAGKREDLPLGILRRGLLEALQIIAGSAPLVLVFEDIQWADDFSCRSLYAEDAPAQSAIAFCYASLFAGVMGLNKARSRFQEISQTAATKHPETRGQVVGMSAFELLRDGDLRGSLTRFQEGKKLAQFPPYRSTRATFSSFANPITPIPIRTQKLFQTWAFRFTKATWASVSRFASSPKTISRVLHRAGGESAWLQLCIVKLPLAQNDQSRFLMTLADTTHRRTAEVMAFLENERKDLSSEIHDDLSQKMVYLNLLRGQVDNPSPELEKARELARELVGDAANLISSLRNPLAEGIDLIEVLKTLTNRFTQDHNIPVQTQWPQSMPPLSDHQSMVLYRVVQEGLANIAKHTRATRVSLSLSYQNNTLTTTLADNGVGFDARRWLQRKAARKHFGLLSMRDRVEMVGGNFRIEAGDGVIVTVVFDLE